ncbi:hypothetical protein G3I19_14970 [Streptomyces sp. SID10853]|uniref:hypothetical protein n=1 Tax=Streptomyces sp. SID10853 TaxID=2706028 RepID=UPI0013BFC63B|nr:hypothetical protein [Streptomyces sp. SID10853]NDZ79786.1 hypothetical protein [Streptomyces sp. SID10853]
MTQNLGKSGPEMSGAEQRSLAVAAATLGPWRSAAAVGAMGGAVSLGIAALAEGMGAHTVTTAVSVALSLFFIVGGAGAALGGRQAGADRRIGRWSAAHPWRVAAVPAALMAVSDLVVRQLLGSESFFSSLGDAVWRGVVVGGVVGLVGRYGGRRG